MSEHIFVGREEEQEALLKSFAQAREGTGQVVFLAGPPGIGKTFLVEHTFSGKKGVRLIQARCSEDDQPYEAITKLLRKYAEMDRNKVHGKEAENFEDNVKKCKEMAKGLSTPDEKSGVTGQQALFSSVEDTFFSIAKNIPLVIFLDNIHVADASSMEFISFISSSIDVLPIMLVGAYRDEEVPDDHLLHALTLLNIPHTTHNIAVEPLNALDILEMVENMLGVKDMPTLFIKRLYKETKGNPIFVREVIRIIKEDQKIDKSDPYWYTKIDLGSITLPGSLKEIVLSQVKRLDEESKEILRYGAAIGESFSGEVVEKAIAQKTDITANKVKNVLESLYKSKLLRMEEDNHKFEYVELQDLLYNEIKDKEKIHLAIAEALEDMNADVYIIAKHFSLAGKIDKTWEYQEKAGDQAVLSMAPLDAMRYFAKSLEALKTATKGKKGKAIKNPDKVRLMLKHGEVAHSLGEMESATGSFNSALKIAKKGKDELLLARTHRRLGDVHRTQSNWDKAREEFTLSLDIVEKTKDSLGMAQSLRGLGYVNWRKGEFDEAITRYSDALKYAEEAKDIPLVGVILIEVGNVYNEKGELDKALRYYLKSVDILTKTKDYSELARAYNNIGDTYLQLDQWKNAVAFFKKTGAVAEKIGNKAMMGWALFNAANALAKDGNPDKAIKYAEGSLKILERIGDGIGLSGVYKGFAIAYRYKEDWSKAEENFKKSIEISLDADSPYTLAEVYLETGSFYHAKGDKKKAAKFLEKARKISGEIGAKVLLKKVEEEKKKAGT